MTNKYLEKISYWIKHSNEEKPKSKGYLAATGVGMGSGTAVTIAGGVYGLNALNKSEKDAPADMNKMRDFVKKKNMHVMFGNDPHELKANGANAWERNSYSKYNPENGPAVAAMDNGKFAILGHKNEHGRIRSEGVLMHELGHVKDFSGTHKHLKHFGSFLGRSHIGKLGFTAAAAGALSSEKKDKYAPAIAAIPGALVLREEFAANKNAHKFIKETSGSSAGKSFIKKTALPNMKANLLAAAALPTGILAARHYLRKKRENDSK